MEIEKHGKTLKEDNGLFLAVSGSKHVDAAKKLLCHEYNFESREISL